MTDALCVDDYGTEVYRCHWSDRLVWADVCRLDGPIMPGVRYRHVAHPDSASDRRWHYRAFADAEQNCNTCRHLKRIPHEKCPHGFLEGVCQRPGHAPCGRSLRFHPEDPMHMPCYESRWGDG